MTDFTPQPSERLLEATRGMRPVRTRSPRRRFAIVSVVSLALPVYSDATEGFRQDLAQLPKPWLFGMGTLWLWGFATSLSRALLPPPAQVLPNPRRAGRRAWVVFGATLAASALLTPAPTSLSRNASIVEATGTAFWEPVYHCVSWALQVCTVLFVAGAVALRKQVFVGARPIGAALGAAGGALAGLDLHLGCPYGGWMHVTAAHAGAVALCAALGALIMPRLMR